MIDLTVKEIAEIVGGRLDSVENPEALVTGFVEFDSRKVAPGWVAASAWLLPKECQKLMEAVQAKDWAHAVHVVVAGVMDDS